VFFQSNKTYANVIGTPPKNNGMIYTGNGTVVNVNDLLQLLILKHYYIEGYCRQVNSHITPGIARSKVIDGPEDGLK